MLITELLNDNAEKYRDEIALVEREPQYNQRRVLTWRKFEDQSNRVARGLMARGVKKGDRAAILMTNCLEWLPIYFGILKSGALAVPLNFRFDANTILKCLATADAGTLVSGEEFIDRIRKVKTELDRFVGCYIFVGPQKALPENAVHFRDFLSTAEAGRPDVNLNTKDDAGIYFTSGTTGTPKGVLLTHGNLEAAAITENQHHRQTHADNFLCIPPLYHTGAKMHWLGNFMVGAKAVILKGVKPEWILEAVSEEAVSIVWLLVPWALDILLAIEMQEVNLADYRLEQWRLMHIGAQPVPPSLVRSWKRVFPGHQYDTNYGLTESTGPGCVHLGMENEEKVGAIGLPGSGWQAMVVDEKLQAVSGDKPGELMIKGPGVMKAYYQNKTATSEALVDGWLLTGDIARQDQDGFLWLVDRKKDVVITGGENIYPVEIEDFLQSHPSIQDVAVIGLPDDRLGEIAAAVIQLKPACPEKEEDMLCFCETLPRYKRPRKIIFSDVPRNPTGKIEKPRLRKHFALFRD